MRANRFLIFLMCFVVVLMIIDFKVEVRKLNSKIVEMKENAEVYKMKYEKFKKEVGILKEIAQDIPELRSKYKRDIDLPLELQLHTYLVCQRLEVDYDLVLAIMRAESSYHKEVVNRNDNGSIDIGLMQINEVHFEYARMIGFNDLHNSRQNIEFAVILLNGLADNVNSTHGLINAYHYGLSGWKELKAEGYEETDYSKAVLNYKEELENEKNY